MSRWDDTSIWVGDGIRREVFFFRSGELDLYGSLYVPLADPRPVGIVICGTWGIEADRSQQMLRDLALRITGLGIAAIMFHYPGYGDSLGDAATVGIPEMTQAAVDAASQGGRRHPDVEWIYCGLRLGATVAAHAALATMGRSLLMLQPALDPAAYVADLVKRARRTSLGAVAPDGRIFGYPVPESLGAPTDGPDPAGLRCGFPGQVGVIAYPDPASTDLLPASATVVTLTGRWRFTNADHPGMVDAAAAWLDANTPGAA